MMKFRLMMSAWIVGLCGMVAAPALAQSEMPGAAATKGAKTESAAPAKADAKPASAKGEGKPAPPAGSAAQDDALVDVNTASEEDLKKLPGIGDALAKKIIAGRPYANKTILKSKKVLPGPTYEKIKDQIIARKIISQ